ncbi:hypothetical protein EYD45_16445 [Hyunsoonleella flava]|uniref:Uncharacterized protein n=1 Tax=Hyunsoonleella flava TaxID=2527939 RepID=A0A4Q9FCX1_9FLAO|nr:hypothetical protein [Hyunsoonleella flava]TBM98487.1 hypothetical protein EYD45_16445 [Hyunsoonleella flava]
MKINKKEIYAFLFALTISLGFLIVPSDFSSRGVIDINIHDTYYVVPALQMFGVYATLIFFIFYLIRMLWRNFKNLTANIIFIISNIVMILIFTFLISLVNSIREISGTTEYPPLSGGIVENTGNGWNNAYYILLIIQLILIILLVISGIKTGLNHKRTE